MKNLVELAFLQVDAAREALGHDPCAPAARRERQLLAGAVLAGAARRRAEVVGDLTRESRDVEVRRDAGRQDQVHLTADGPGLEAGTLCNACVELDAPRRCLEL